VDIKVLALIGIAVVLYAAFKIVTFVACGCLGLCSSKQSAAAHAKKII
jgi:hypothetical protein